MRHIERNKALIAALLIPLLLSPRPALANVVFTGYADLEYVPWSNINVATNFPAALSANGTTVARSFDSAGLGLFAATDINDELKFQMDVTYNNVGYQVNQIQIPYAYLVYTPLADTTFKGGRITLPFGYYNENYFYPFQRYAISAPEFQSLILGLPIADWGAEAQQKFELAPFTAEFSAYTVNGYANAPGNPNSLRGVGLPGSVTFGNNVGSTDNNDQPALGGRLRLIDIGGAPVESGFSYYYDDWNAGGSKPLRLADAHIHFQYGGLDLLWEGLQMDVRGDQGFVSSVGSPNYETLGYFATGSYKLGSLKSIPVVVFAQGEQYRTRGLGVSTPDEKLQSFAAGVDFQLAETVRLKTEYLHFYYWIPFAGDYVREEEDAAAVAVVVTF